ncbi:hypothetical protein F2P56_033716 [Juglans regia]|uniref:ADP-ribosyl cyclase/cyclic ADP-ribose hydrolase n=2 Tax=Juglans regia TaxID=51240 RepID=A0A833WTF6_JUGRE|nr:disease resistance protein RPV1-like [Juglans regia]KAF5444592.1 hypothetical protein F2P56_033716 [Juglans regia]
MYRTLRDKELVELHPSMFSGTFLGRNPLVNAAKDEAKEASPNIDPKSKHPAVNIQHDDKPDIIPQHHAPDQSCHHLYKALCKKFIIPFKHDERLEIGTPIKKELLEAIEKSRMAVIIISKEYASSTWCLEELAEIVECMKDRELKVLPIFYYVDPRDVGKPDETFRDAFAEHEENIENKDKVQTWRNALKKVANLSGFHLKSG